MKSTLLILSVIYCYALPVKIYAQASVSKIFYWKNVLNDSMPAAEDLAARDAQAKKQAIAAIQLYRTGHLKEIIPLLKLKENPSARSYFIRDLGSSNTKAAPLIHQLKIEKEPSVRRAIILCLGGFDSSAISGSEQKSVTTFLLNMYRTADDAGIHSAIDWLLRYDRQGLNPRKINWAQRETLEKIDKEFAGQDRRGRNWICTKEGQTLSVIEGPVTYTMGTPGFEPGRDKSNAEALHQQQVPRSFAIATKEVTVKQFQRFLDSNPDIKELAKMGGNKNPSRDGSWMQRLGLDDNAPQVFMTWFEAAQYCNWLSAQEGIPEDQWCYPTMKEIKEGMMLPVSYLHRTGYRMPTEAEWQYTCRAGTSSMRSFGDAEELLSEFAWFSGNTFNQRPYPVGQLKPNDFGLFDMYGNVWEWGQDLIKSYRALTKDSTRIDTEDESRIVSKDFKRPRLGGSYTYSADYLRSGYRNEGYIPDERRDSVGFRIARTMP